MSGPSPDATRSPGIDYVALSGTVTIPANQTSWAFGVTNLDDLLFEGDETVDVRLLPGGYVIGSSSNASVTIVDDEGA